MFMCELCFVIFGSKCELSCSFVNFNKCFNFVVNANCCKKKVGIKCLEEKIRI
jgi:hypothetical protein